MYRIGRANGGPGGKGRTAGSANDKKFEKMGPEVHRPALYADGDRSELICMGTSVAERSGDPIVSVGGRWVCSFSSRGIDWRDVEDQFLLLYIF